MHRRAKKRNRRGAMAVLAAMCLDSLLAMVAFAFDIGDLLVTQMDLQRAADAAAHAAVLERRSEISPCLLADRANSLYA